ncbi:alpha/beta-hydrolase [Violaceomyces palustris]|uniref:Alpha/beta-hydrolase n=1 Tax=Violaceomyces palustris TaxID=1673888 RepID=A0ACD0NZX1_9BASI|nr:alpha/beta-hydrolase [Violaceomyces palustris]
MNSNTLLMTRAVRGFEPTRFLFVSGRPRTLWTGRRDRGETRSRNLEGGRGAILTKAIHPSLFPTAALARQVERSFSSSSSSNLNEIKPKGESVELDFETFHPSIQRDQGGGVAAALRPESVVVCHGLFGSKQNWRSLGKSMAGRFGVPVYTLDLRNHGTSPHVEGISYADMANDVLGFIRQKGLKRVGLIGHSMGGKVVQALTLSPSLPKGLVSHLVSVDMAPARGPISKEFEEYIEGMLEIERSQVRTRSEADKILEKIEKDLGVRQFLLTNLHRNPPESPTWSFRIPVETIKRNLSQIGDFPYDPPGYQGDDAGKREVRSWEDGKVLFIKGAKSKYINRRNIPTCEAYFPGKKLSVMDTGHWCQAERPNEFVDIVDKFFRGEEIPQH